MPLFAKLGNYRNSGLLIIRLGLGVMFILHGFPKLAGGPEKWETIGASMKNIHITFYPLIWGLLAALTETFGGFYFCWAWLSDRCACYWPLLCLLRPWAI